MTFSLPPVEGRAKMSLVCNIREGFPPKVVVAWLRKAGGTLELGAGTQYALIAPF